MKKSITVWMAFLLAIVSVFSLVGCGPEGFQYDKTKTQLFVYSFDGGVGVEWLDKVSERFERDYANISFEKGKTGVEIIPGKGKDTLVSGLSTSPYEVIFSESINYNNLIAQGSIMEIDDIVAQKTLEEVSGGKEKGTIADKMTPQQKSAFTATDGKHYVLPHYEVYSGLTYDVKVFTDKSLFFKDGGGWTKVDSEKSVGPDGIRNTYDDGLPSSFEEFDKLLDRMVSLKVAPFVWAGQYPEYTNHMLLGMWAAFTGKDEFMLNFNYGKDSLTDGGSSHTVTGFDGVTPTVEVKDIAPATGYYLKQQEGKYYPLRVLEKVVNDSRYYSDLITGVTTHMDAQRFYLNSDLENKPIAMLIDGSYWYNEAKDAFAASENKYKDKARNRQFAWMPLPRQASGSVTEGNGTKNTLVESLSSFAVINNNIRNKPDKIALAKTFLQYCYTDESLVEFTRMTGIPKGLSYEMKDEDIAEMSYYGKSLFEVKSKSDVVYPYSDNRIFIYNQERVLDSSSWSSTVGGTPYVYPYTAIKAGKSAKDYFLGMEISASDWEKKFGQYYKD